MLASPQHQRTSLATQGRSIRSYISLNQHSFSGSKTAYSPPFILVVSLSLRDDCVRSERLQSPHHLPRNPLILRITRISQPKQRKPIPNPISINSSELGGGTHLRSSSKSPGSPGCKSEFHSLLNPTGGTPPPAVGITHTINSLSHSSAYRVLR